MLCAEMTDVLAPDRWEWLATYLHTDLNGVLSMTGRELFAAVRVEIHRRERAKRGYADTGSAAGWPAADELARVMARMED